MYIAWPPADGTGINDEYVLKAYFSKALADGLSESDLLDRFLVRYGSDDSWPGSAQVLDPGALAIVYNETADYHALTFTCRISMTAARISNIAWRSPTTARHPTPI